MTEETNALPMGFSLHRYQLETVLGAGGFGITYRALHEALENRVAIKEYFPAEWAYRDHDGTTVRANSQGQIPARTGEPPCYEWGLQRFLDEAKILVQINHPCVVRVRDYFSANGSAYIVMEYEDGESLSTLLQRGGILPEHELRHLLDDVMPALEAVHGQGYLHRDLKPSNLYIRTADGRIMLIDFGAARQALGRRTRSVTSVVTPGYSPIEQYVTVGEDYGPWTDIYALGAVLYRCITGAPPIEAPGRVLKDPVQPAMECGAGLYSRPLLRVVDQALAVRPEDRFQTVAAMREALRMADQTPERSSFPQITAEDAELLDLSLLDEHSELEPLSLPSKPSGAFSPDDPWGKTRNPDRRSKPSQRVPDKPSPPSRPSRRMVETSSDPLKKGSGWTRTDFDLSRPASPTGEALPVGPSSGSVSDSLPLLDNFWEQLDAGEPQSRSPVPADPLAATAQAQTQSSVLNRAPPSVVVNLRKAPLSRTSVSVSSPLEQPSFGREKMGDEQSSPVAVTSVAIAQEGAPLPRARPLIQWRSVLFATLALSGLSGVGLLGYEYFKNVQEQQRLREAQRQQEQEESARQTAEEAKRQEADIADQSQKIRDTIANGNLIGAELSLERLMEAYPNHPLLAPLRSELLTAKRQGLGVKTWTESKTGLKLVLVNGGCFSMGSPAGERDHASNESPHQVCLKNFWISTTEVSNGQYRRFKPDHNSGSFQGRPLNQDAQPAVNLTWDQARSFAEWLSWEAKGNKRFRLPTEAEWEYAARAGTTTRYYWGNEIDPRYANFSDRNDPTGASIGDLDDGQAVSAFVGSYQPNRLNLRDMAGNVWEWVCSEYDPKYSGQELGCSDKPPTEGLRVTRGGSWNSGPGDLRAAKRLPRKPDYRDAMTGFRVIMEE